MIEKSRAVGLFDADLVGDGQAYALQDTYPPGRWSGDKEAIGSRQ